MHLPFGLRIGAMFFTVCGLLLADTLTVQITEAVLVSAEHKYGPTARTRLKDWVQLLEQIRKKSDEEKLQRVNSFFNQIPFVSDLDHWAARDYWATPVELIASNGGDCEDYAIAKYFSLLATGFPVEKLRITYVKALKQPQNDQAHMVLTYFTTPSAMPLVLDNLDTVIRPANQRTDLVPVYSFNASGLWLAKERSSGRSTDNSKVGSASQLSLWNELMARMGRELQ